MADGDIDLYTDQKILLGIAGLSFLFFFILLDEGDDDGMLCCCTTVLLLLAVPFAATKNPTNTTHNPLGLDNLLNAVKNILLNNQTNQVAL